MPPSLDVLLMLVAGEGGAMAGTNNRTAGVKCREREREKGESDLVVEGAVVYHGFIGKGKKIPDGFSLSSFVFLASMSVCFDIFMY